MAVAPENKDRSAGFTLVELLVVMVILGILASTAVSAYTNQRRKAWDVRAKAQVRTAVLALLATYDDAGAVTTDQAVMQAAEPSLSWRTSAGVTTSNPPPGTIDFENSTGGSTTAVLVAASQSGRCFYARIIATPNALGPVGVGYLALPGPCTDPWDQSAAAAGATY